MKKLSINWLNQPEVQNYPAAAAYLALLFPSKEVKLLINQLKKTSLTEFKAKDIFRASRLSLLGVSNYHVEIDKKKIKKGDKKGDNKRIKNEIKIKFTLY